MKKVVYLFNGKQFIKNSGLPICKNCVHFVEHENNYPYDQAPNNDIFGQCKIFGNISMVTGITKYEYARNCREDNNKCGHIGSQYVQK